MLAGCGRWLQPARLQVAEIAIPNGNEHNPRHALAHKDRGHGALSMILLTTAAWRPGGP